MVKLSDVRAYGGSNTMPFCVIHLIVQRRLNIEEQRRRSYYRAGLFPGNFSEEV